MNATTLYVLKTRHGLFATVKHVCNTVCDPVSGRTFRETEEAGILVVPLPSQSKRATESDARTTLAPSQGEYFHSRQVVLVDKDDLPFTLVEGDILCLNDLENTIKEVEDSTDYNAWIVTAVRAKGQNHATA